MIFGGADFPHDGDSRPGLLPVRDQRRTAYDFMVTVLVRRPGCDGIATPCPNRARPRARRTLPGTSLPDPRGAPPGVPLPHHRGRPSVNAPRNIHSKSNPGGESPQVLVVEHEAECPPGLWGGWPAEAGLRLRPRAPLSGRAPARGPSRMRRAPRPGGSPGPLDDDRCPWLPVTRALLRTAVEGGTPTFGICPGAELMTTEFGGRAERRARPQVGVYGLEVLPTAAGDPLFAG